LEQTHFYTCLRPNTEEITGQSGISSNFLVQKSYSQPNILLRFKQNNLLWYNGSQIIMTHILCKKILYTGMETLKWTVSWVSSTRPINKLLSSTEFWSFAYKIIKHVPILDYSLSILLSVLAVKVMKCKYLSITFYIVSCPWL
jgi:hypothetical protein